MLGRFFPANSNWPIFLRKRRTLESVEISCVEPISAAVYQISDKSTNRWKLTVRWQPLEWIWWPIHSIHSNWLWSTQSNGGHGNRMRHPIPRTVAVGGKIESNSVDSFSFRNNWLIQFGFDFTSWRPRATFSDGSIPIIYELWNYYRAVHSDIYQRHLLIAHVYSTQSIYIIISLIIPAFPLFNPNCLMSYLIRNS